MNISHRWKRLVSTVVATALCASSVQAIPASAKEYFNNTDPLNFDCVDLEVVYARGSGQGASVDGNKELERLITDLKSASEKTKFSVNLNNLGQHGYVTDPYPAVPVGYDSWESINNSAGAALTFGQARNYGDSVKKGVKEATEYINTRMNKCSSSQFFLAGYSQGAQVMNEVYSHSLNDSARERVIFSALFGDPRLYLPEGKIPLYFGNLQKMEPLLVTEGKKSEWRRDVPNPRTYIGSLRNPTVDEMVRGYVTNGATGISLVVLGRIGDAVAHKLGTDIPWLGDDLSPYLPVDWTSNTGLWCNDHDFVCGSSPFIWSTKAHEQYGDPGGAVDQAVQEAFLRLSAKKGQVGLEFEKQLRKLTKTIKKGTKGLDLVFLIDTTQSMSDDIDNAKKVASDVASELDLGKDRVALVEFKDSYENIPARIVLPFGSSSTNFQRELSGLQHGAENNWDYPEGALFGLKTAFNGLDWREGATKTVILLTDDGFKNPDDLDGTTLDEIVKRSMEIDPVNVYPVIPSWLSDDKIAQHTELAERTSGQVIFNDGDAAVAIKTALKRVVDRPVVKLSLNEYWVNSTDETVFDASASYSVDSEIVRWDWDFDGDGIFEVEDGDSIVGYTYPETGDFNVNVRATDALGQIASHSVPVHVNTTTGLPDFPEPSTSLSVQDDNGDLDVRWGADSEPSGGWLIKANGIILGRTEPQARRITITDVPQGEDVEISVVPMTDDGLVGYGFSAGIGESIDLNEIINQLENSDVNSNGSSDGSSDGSSNSDNDTKTASSEGSSSDSAGKNLEASGSTPNAPDSKIWEPIIGVLIPVLLIIQAGLRAGLTELLYSFDLPSWVYRAMGL